MYVGLLTMRPIHCEWSSKCAHGLNKAAWGCAILTVQMYCQDHLGLSKLYCITILSK